MIIGETEKEDLLARLSAYEFLLEILLANLMAKLPPAEIAEAIEDISRLAGRPFGRITGDIDVAMKQRRRASALQATVERILERSQQRAEQIR